VAGKPAVCGILRVPGFSSDHGRQGSIANDLFDAY